VYRGVIGETWSDSTPINRRRGDAGPSGLASRGVGKDHGNPSSVQGDMMDESGDVTDQGTGRVAQSMEEARSEAGQLVTETRAEASTVADEARYQAGEVAHEAREQAGELVATARHRLHDQADAQAARLADSMRGVGSELASMADSSEHPDSGVADVARELAGGVGRFAGRLEDRGIDGALDDVRRYARRYPGRFLLGAAAAGFVIGRFLRNVDTEVLTGASGDNGAGEGYESLGIADTRSGSGVGTTGHAGATGSAVPSASAVGGGVATSPLTSSDPLTEGGTTR
jgi:hypothetical protein